MNTITATRTEAIAHAREVDTEVARLWGEFHKVQDIMNRISASKADTIKHQNASWNRNPINQERIAARLESYDAELAELRPKAEAAREIAAAYDDANYEGWTRFFLVKHIHNTTRCSSFRITTRVGWLPDVSGLTEAEAVAAHGETLCTICFPSAPTELTTKQADPNLCTGKPDWTKPYRMGYVSGNYAVCTDCGEHASLTTAGNLRKHKKASA